MMVDEAKAARVHVDATAIDFGKFADWQLPNVGNAIGVNVGAPAIGTGVAIHEIWENCVSRTSSGQGLYGDGHRLMKMNHAPATSAAVSHLPLRAGSSYTGPRLPASGP
jgi:hypothetical protein